MTNLNVHWRKYNPTDHLCGSDLERDGKKCDFTVTINRIAIEKVGDEKATKPILYFTENIAENKGMICGAKNSRNIEKVLRTPIIGEWIGKQITIYGIEEKNFGKVEYVVRVRPVPPVPPKKESLTPTHPKWEGAKAALSGGKTTVEAIRNVYELSAENEKLLKEVKNA
jgi:hypothetical protein